MVIVNAALAAIVVVVVSVMLTELQVTFISKARILVTDYAWWSVLMLNLVALTSTFIIGVNQWLI